VIKIGTLLFYRLQNCPALNATNTQLKQQHKSAISSSRHNKTLADLIPHLTTDTHWTVTRTASELPV